MRFAEFDAVTVDAYGTLVALRDPAPALSRALRERGTERALAAIRGAFAAEVAYYTPRALHGRDEESLGRLREECAAVFLHALGADLPADEFAYAFVGALEFELLPGVAAALTALHARGIELAVVANWDTSLAERLETLQIARFFSAIVTSAEAGVAKPEAGIFRLALERLAVRPERALHVGDSPTDEDGARAAAMRFAAAPLATAFDGWP